MSKIFNYYANDIDRAWYDSSTVKYSECIDPDDRLKTLRVVFNNGTKYEYKDVATNDYLLFREDASQGKALNKYIKGRGYEYEKLDNVNVEDLDEELQFRTDGGLFIDNNDKYILKDSIDNVLLEMEGPISNESLSVVKETLMALSYKVKVNRK